MKTSTFYLINFILLFFSGLSAETTFLILGGYNNTSFRTTESKSQTGLIYGIGLDFSLSKKLSLELNLLKSERSAIIEDKIIGGWPVDTIELWDLYCSIKYTHIPILLKYNLYHLKKFKIQLYSGLGFDIANADKSYRYNERFKGEVGDDTYWKDIEFDYKYVYESTLGSINNSGASLLIGAKLEYSFLFVDIRFMNDLHSISTLSGAEKSSRTGYGDIYDLDEKMVSYYFLIGLQTKINWGK